MFHFFTAKKVPRKPSLPEACFLAANADTGEAELSFSLIRDRFKTLRIMVKPEGRVLVKAPARMREGDIARMVQCRRGWIEAKLALFRQRTPLPERRYEDGEIFYYLGRPFPLRLLPGEGRRLVVSLRGNNLEVRGSDMSPEAVAKALAVWRKAVTAKLTSKRLARLHGRACSLLQDCPAPPLLRIKTLKRRWGSCSLRGEMTLASRISALPLEFVDYILLHELCHLRRMDHSPSFHALMARLLPEERKTARSLHAWAREHSCD